jgi:hypothetical protein
MPKKTKKEKIIAAYRKQLKLLQTKSPGEITGESKKSNDIRVEKKDNEIVSEENITPTSEENRTKLAFTADLKKSLFLISCVIALEIGLYFVMLKR